MSHLLLPPLRVVVLVPLLRHKLSVCVCVFLNILSWFLLLNVLMVETGLQLCHRSYCRNGADAISQLLLFLRLEFCLVV